MPKTRSDEAHGKPCAREAAVISTSLVTQPQLAVGLLRSHGSIGRPLVPKPCSPIRTSSSGETLTHSVSTALGVLPGSTGPEGLTP